MVKVIGNAPIADPLEVRVDAISNGAAEIIQKAGGQVILSGKVSPSKA
jgi:ribosomal protein L15